MILGATHIQWVGAKDLVNTLQCPGQSPHGSHLAQMAIAPELRNPRLYKYKYIFVIQLEVRVVH